MKWPNRQNNLDILYCKIGSLLKTWLGNPILEKIECILAIWNKL